MAPITLPPGGSITIAAETCPPPPACPGDCGDGICDAAERCVCTPDCGVPPMMEALCADGIDNDCDGSTDCADMDCMSEPACTSEPPGEGPPLAGLEMWSRWDIAHAVTPGVEPAQTIPGCEPPTGCSPPPSGSAGHHLIDLVPAMPVRELTEKSAAWWGIFGTDGLYMDGTDQLLFETCTSLDPLICSEVPWTAASDDRWAFVFVGAFSGSGAIVGNPSEAGNLSIMDFSAGGHLRLRLQASGRVTISAQIVPWGTPHVLLVEYDAGTLRAWRRLPCGAGFEDATVPTPPMLVRTAIFGCLSCYYPNGWINGNGTEEPHYPGIMAPLRETMLYRGAYDQAGLLSYLDAAHGPWIDAGCAP